jgi:hypothetical protein
MIRTYLRWLLLAYAIFACCEVATAADKLRKEKPMDTNNVQILSTSNDPNKLYAAAMSLVNSHEEVDHSTLLQFLSKENFLGRLDTAKDYMKGKKYLRISRLIKAMRQSTIPGIHGIIAGLASQKEFIANETRVELLIWASEVVRPPSSGLVKFWDDHCKPDDGFNGLTAVALTNNGTEQAIALLEKKLAAPSFEDDERIWWMRTAILTHRYDVQLLKACQRLLTSSLEESLRPELVSVLFDYRPVEWHGPDDGYPPPKAETASKEAKQLLLAIGEYALAHIKLDHALRKIVQAKVELEKKNS